MHESGEQSKTTPPVGNGGALISGTTPYPPFLVHNVHHIDVLRTIGYIDNHIGANQGPMRGAPVVLALKELEFCLWHC